MKKLNQSAMDSKLANVYLLGMSQEKIYSYLTQLPEATMTSILSNANDLKTLLQNLSAEQCQQVFKSYTIDCRN